MQYLIENADGSRTPISGELANVAQQCRCEGTGERLYQTLVNTSTVQIFRRKDMIPASIRQLVFGGRGNSKSPVGYRGG
jgi:hypothetical protein